LWANILLLPGKTGGGINTNHILIEGSSDVRIAVHFHGKTWRKYQGHWVRTLDIPNKNRMWQTLHSHSIVILTDQELLASYDL